jgi:hypothetical protein
MKTCFAQIADTCIAKMKTSVLNMWKTCKQTIVNNKYLLQFAKESGLTEIVDLLENAGAKESIRG